MFNWFKKEADPVLEYIQAIPERKPTKIVQGKVYQLNSGGPLMTAGSQYLYGDWCFIWFDPCGEKQWYPFPEECVTEVRKDGL